MDIKNAYLWMMKHVHPGLLSKLTEYAEKLPPVARMIEEEYAGIAREMESMVRPYRDRFPVMKELPGVGRDRGDILDEMREMRKLEEPRWKEGYASGAVYNGDEAHIEFLNEAYAINSQSNPLHSDLWPSAARYEAEIVSMTAGMLGAGEAGATEKGSRVCGVVSSGGTESIMLAVKAYRDRARAKRNICRPEMVLPTTAHAAFDKAAECFGVKAVHVPVGDDFRADVEATAKAVNRETILVVGSAPQFPHGVIDPIRELSELAMERKVGFHTDACLGGFLLPWARKLGYEVPAFDFSLPGVTSISVDTHKYGYAAKGTSVVLYRGEELRHFQYFKTMKWPGGLYFTPTFAGSRPGALAAACWASMVSMGEKGYLESAAGILETAGEIKRGLAGIPELEVLGDPLWVIAFTSKEVDIYDVMEHMTEKGWSLNGLQDPPAIHICITLRHTAPGVAGRFIEDLKSAVALACEPPGEGSTRTAIYGLGSTFPDKRLVGRGLDMYMDMIYSVGED